MSGKLFQNWNLPPTTIRNLRVAHKKRKNRQTWNATKTDKSSLLYIVMILTEKI